MSKGLTSIRFPVSLEGTHGVNIPNAVGDPFREAGHKRVRITAYFQDKILHFHGALHYRNGDYIISFGKRYQKELGIFPSDFFELQFFEDQSKYGVDMPEEFQAVLDSDLEGAAIFEQLTAGKKRSLIYYITRFKTAQSRIDKSINILENLKHGIRDPKTLIRLIK